jgi:hypothetical protein
MLRRTIMTAVLAAAVLFPMLSSPVQAHHSNANYDQSKTVTLKGTVAAWDWGNPHVMLVWDVKDESGKVVRWESFLASVETELSDGLTKDSLKPGDSVIAVVHAAKDGSPHSVAVEVRKGDGSILCAPCTGQKGPGSTDKIKNYKPNN